MELVALWVSFSSPGCQLPWVGFLSYYMKVILCLNIPGRSVLWSGIDALGSKIVLYFQIPSSPSLPIRVTLRRGMEQKFQFYCQLFRPLRCFNKGDYDVLKMVTFFVNVILEPHCAAGQGSSSGRLGVVGDHMTDKLVK